MIKLGKHTITSYTFDAHDNATFRIDTKRAKTYSVSRDEFRAIMALDVISESIDNLDWLRHHKDIEETMHQTVMAHLSFWQQRLTEDVDKIKSKLDLD